MQTSLSIFLISFVLLFNSCVVLSEKESITVYGCTDSTAVNFIPEATMNDGSCTYILGCTDSKADNYNSSATTDDKSCTYTTQVIFYSNGSWVPLGFNESRIEIYDSNQRELLHTINSNRNANYQNENCGNYKGLNSDQRLFYLKVEPNTNQKVQVHFWTYEIDNNGNVTFQKVEQTFSISIPNQLGYCTFYNLTY